MGGRALYVVIVTVQTDPTCEPERRDAPRAAPGRLLALLFTEVLPGLLYAGVPALTVTGAIVAANHRGCHSDGVWTRTGEPDAAAWPITALYTRPGVFLSFLDVSVREMAVRLDRRSRAATVRTQRRWTGEDTDQVGDQGSGPTRVGVGSKRPSPDPATSASAANAKGRRAAGLRSSAGRLP